MRTTILTSFSAVLLSMLLLSAAGRPEPLPQDLRTETLLVLFFDNVPRSVRGWEKHNELVAALNVKTQEALQDYPYPYVTATRSNYIKKVDVPPHTYVLNSILMEEFNEGDNIHPGEKNIADVKVVDTRSEKEHIVLENKYRTEHMFLKYALKEIPKRVEKGK
jgi:hypothetical protein